MNNYVYQIHTPDPWAHPKPELYFTLGGKNVSIFDVVGTTPDKTPIINHFGISGGKDSDAIFLWALKRSGYPIDSIICTTCETYNEDVVTYAQIQLLRNLHPIHRIMPERTLWEVIRHKKMFPTRRKRFCTQLMKMEPARYFVHALTDVGFKVLIHSGVRGDESNDRSKLPEREYDNYFGLEIYRPMQKWTIKDVVQIHHEFNMPFNPLYKMGARRVGCFPCINSVKREMRLVSEYRPEKIDFIEREELAVSELSGKPKSFFHRSSVPLRFRSLDYITKKGETIKIATIRDVVKWSLTGKRAMGRYDDNKEFEGFREEDFQTCSLTYGACE